MIIIGLTGGIASGKSTVSKIIGEYDIPVIDADIIARDIVKKGSQVLHDIQQQFGSDILNNDGTLNRKRLGELVFSDKEKLIKLNNITHPAVKNQILREIEILKAANIKCCVIDVPLLIESKFTDMVNYIVLIYVDNETQLNRLMIRDKITREEAKKRIQSQMGFEEKRKYAHYILDNGGTIEQTRTQLNSILKEICLLEELHV